uniref:Uncharacterized protein n=1 Tax=Ascaris lumbricoides TaxID=6252 RepID=A0A9J2PY70_ASCLU
MPNFSVRRSYGSQLFFSRSRHIAPSFHILLKSAIEPTSDMTGGDSFTSSPFFAHEFSACTTLPDCLATNALRALMNITTNKLDHDSTV